MTTQTGRFDFVAKGLVAMGLLTVLGGLLGCKPGFKDTSALENPPPKPPNCSNVPELTNMRLSDGSLADVRIIQVRNIKLYVPTEWLRPSYFVDKFRDRHGFISESDLRRFAPDIHETECPGVVHRFVEGRDLVDFGFRFIDRVRGLHFKNISLQSKIDAISFIVSRNHMQHDSIENSMYPYINARIRPNKYDDRLIVAYPWPENKDMSSTEWNIYRDSVLELVGWLQMPPKARDNNYIFVLGNVGQ